MNKLLLCAPVLAGAAVMSLPSAVAQMLVAPDDFNLGYTFNSSNSDTPNPAAPSSLFTDPNASLGNLTRAAGFHQGNNGAGGNGNGFSVAPSGLNGQNSYGSTVAQDTAIQFYVTFTLTPSPVAPNNIVSLTNLTFGGGFQNGDYIAGPNNTTIIIPNTTTVGLSYSTDGGMDFTTINPATTTFLGNASGDVGDGTVSSFSLGSQPGLANVTSPVIFRLFVLSTLAHGYEDADYINRTSANGLDIEVDGYAVPEPATSAWTMMAVGSGLLLGAQRLRRRRDA